MVSATPHVQHLFVAEFWLISISNNSPVDFLGCLSVRSFASSNTAGNIHCVAVFSHDCEIAGRDFDRYQGDSKASLKQQLTPFPRSELVSLSRPDHAMAFSTGISPTTLVILHLMNGGIAIRFFQNGREVQRCGSGLLAASYTLWRLNYFHNSIGVKTPLDTYRIGTAGKYFYFEDNSLPYRQVNRRWANIANRTIKRALFAGSQTDYLILELTDQSAVTQCRINGWLATQITKRAIILTAKSRSPNYDYVLRYLLPGRPVYEDSATGSANLAVAEYWQQQLGKQRLKGRQLSPQGGDFIVLRRGCKQRIMGEAGECSLEDFE